MSETEVGLPLPSRVVSHARAWPLRNGGGRWLANLPGGEQPEFCELRVNGSGEVEVWDDGIDKWVCPASRWAQHATFLECTPQGIPVQAIALAAERDQLLDPVSEEALLRARAPESRVLRIVILALADGIKNGLESAEGIDDAQLVDWAHGGMQVLDAGAPVTTVGVTVMTWLAILLARHTSTEEIKL